VQVRLTRKSMVTESIVVGPHYKDVEEPEEAEYEWEESLFVPMTLRAKAAHTDDEAPGGLRGMYNRGELSQRSRRYQSDIIKLELLGQRTRDDELKAFYTQDFDISQYLQPGHSKAQDIELEIDFMLPLRRLGKVGFKRCIWKLVLDCMLLRSDDEVEVMLERNEAAKERRERQRIWNGDKLPNSRNARSKEDKDRLNSPGIQSKEENLRRARNAAQSKEEKGS